MRQRRSARQGRTWLGLAALTLGSLLPGALAQSSANPFTTYLNQGSRNPTWRNPVRADDLPYSTNVQIIAEHLLGNYPTPGPHLIELSSVGRAEYLRRHLEQVRRDVPNWLPNPNFDGYAVIDYEAWYPYWTTHFNFPSNAGADANDMDPLDDWRDYIRANRASLLTGLNADQQEQVFRETWLDITREFFELTLQECRQMRPHAKWGFYMLPGRHYFAWRSTEQANLIRFANDQELGWLWDRVDAIFPSIYTFYYSVGDRPRQDGEDLPYEHADYVRNNVAEAIRISRDKPVVPVLWAAYHNSNRRYGLQIVNDINMRQMFEIPLDLGVRDFILWDWIENDQYRRDLVNFANNRLNPYLRDLVVQHTPPAPPPPPIDPPPETPPPSDPPPQTPPPSDPPPVIPPPSDPPPVIPPPSDPPPEIPPPSDPPPSDPPPQLPEDPTPPPSDPGTSGPSAPITLPPYIPPINPTNPGTIQTGGGSSGSSGSSGQGTFTPAGSGISNPSPSNPGTNTPGGRGGFIGNTGGSSNGSAGSSGYSGSPPASNVSGATGNTSGTSNPTGSSSGSSESNSSDASSQAAAAGGGGGGGGGGGSGGGGSSGGGFTFASGGGGGGSGSVGIASMGSGLAGPFAPGVVFTDGSRSRVDRKAEILAARVGEDPGLLASLEGDPDRPLRPGDELFLSSASVGGVLSPASANVTGDNPLSTEVGGLLARNANVSGLNPLGASVTAGATQTANVSGVNPRGASVGGTQTASAAVNGSGIRSAGVSGSNASRARSISPVIQRVTSVPENP